jgi:hypothetical protein
VCDRLVAVLPPFEFGIRHGVAPLVTAYMHDMRAARSGHPVRNSARSHDEDAAV